MKTYRSHVAILLFLLMTTVASMSGGEPSPKPTGLPVGAEWATEELFLDKAAGIKELAEGYQLLDETTKKIIRIGEWRFSMTGVSMYRTEVYNEKGILHGPKIVYSGKDRPQFVVNYANGVVDGKSQTFHPTSGVLVLEAEYKAGLLNGWRITYALDGKVASKVLYVDGKPQK